MGIFFQHLATFFSSLFNVATDQTRRIKNAFLITFACAFLIYMVQWAFNSTATTIIIAVICDIIIVWKWFDVPRLTALFFSGEAIDFVEAIGARTRKKTPAESGKEPVKPEEVESSNLRGATNAVFHAYITAALYIIFWVHVICFFVPLMPLRENPLFGLFFLFGGTIYIIMYPDGRFFRKFLAWGAVLVLILMSFQMISLTGWVKLGWMEPYWALRTSDVDRSLAKALKADKEAADKKVAARLDEIAKKRDRGEELSEADKKLLEEQKGKGLISAIFAPSAVAKTPPPAAPKREPQKKTVKFPLEFVGGENLVREPERIGIRKGGHANFRVSLPNVINGKYKVHYHGQRIKEGRDFLEINRGKGIGAPFDIKHSATDFPIELRFFDDGYAIGMPGENKYFRSGENYFKLWADDNLLVQLDKQPYVEITYWQ